MAAQAAQLLLPMSVVAAQADRLAVAITQDCTPTRQRRLPVKQLVVPVAAAVVEASAITTAVAVAVLAVVFVTVTVTAARLAAQSVDPAAGKSADRAVDRLADDFAEAGSSIPNAPKLWMASPFHEKWIRQRLP